MNSFFQKDATGKRYAISRRDGEPFGIAGIWENWRDPLTSAWEGTFAVITVPAETSEGGRGETGGQVASEVG